MSLTLYVRCTWEYDDAQTTSIALTERYLNMQVMNESFYG